MYQVAVLKADYEGWWLFEGWQDDLTDIKDFNSEMGMINYYEKLIEQMAEEYHTYQKGRYHLIAFYNACELEYCEDCEEDLQIFYTPLCMKNNAFMEVPKIMNIL
ncbi:DUF1033 family protein [Salinicoccus sp. YB14-2]|uniref:DUF1033 family protein n=1 Tax=Salinicoccus sp. YB14-2 TaxID=1572701 RepID=UPI000691C193|nr:DUF1033 family protein [Salinicoccus sp. YB14-2]